MTRGARRIRFWMGSWRRTSSSLPSRHTSCTVGSKWGTLPPYAALSSLWACSRWGLARVIYMIHLRSPVALRWLLVVRRLLSCVLRGHPHPQGTVRVVNSMTVEPLFDLETLFRPKPVVVSNQVSPQRVWVRQFKPLGSTEVVYCIKLGEVASFARRHSSASYCVCASSLSSLHSTSGPCVHPASTRAHSPGP